MRTLYISYSGLMEALGQSQVLEYLKLLAGSHEIDLITFEKREDWDDLDRRDALVAEVRRAGIRWTPLRYHRTPSIPATAFDVVRGLAVASRIVSQRRIQIVHARSYIPALVALHLKRRFGVRFVFDLRGFWPDEKVDAGTWTHGSATYRLAKKLERSALLSADVVVSLTHAGVRAMQTFDYLQGREKWFEVIPTCTNLELFVPPDTASADRTDRFRLGYVGNVGGSYMFDPVLTVFSTIQSVVPAARLTLINKGQHETIRHHLASRGVSAQHVDCQAMQFRDVPNAMREMDATAFFIKPTYSKLASAPTKLGEFLACGVPCMINDGVGDMGTIVREEGVGVVLQSLDADAIRTGTHQLIALARDPAVRERCVRTAAKYFSLRAGAESYDRVYHRLLGRSAPGWATGRETASAGR